MNLRFEHVMPHPLKEYAHNEKSIWGQDVTFISGTHNVLNATSGKGKSTFTGILAGIRCDYTGTFLLDNLAQHHMSVEEWSNVLQSKLSFVFQDLQLFPELTVGENLQLKNQLTSFKSEKEMKELVEQVGLVHRWNDPCGILSMGQQQRIALIRALCQPFQWLVLDEPFSHLDEENSSICLSLLSDACRKQGAGFILTTLNPELRYTFDHEYFL